MDLIDIVSKVIELSRKKEQFSDQVKSLQLVVLTIKDSVQKISKFGVVPEEYSLFSNIQGQLSEALQELEQTPKEMTLLQKTMSLLPGNIIQKIKDRTTQLLQLNSLLQTHLQTLILTTPSENMQKTKLTKQLNPTFVEPDFAPTLEDRDELLGGKYIRVDLTIRGRQDVLDQFRRKGEPLVTSKQINFAKDELSKVIYQLGRVKVIFLQDKFPNEVNRVSKQHLEIRLQRIRVGEVFLTCKEDADQDHPASEQYKYSFLVDVKSANGCYHREEGGKDWRKVGKGEKLRLAGSDNFAILMVKPSNKEPLFYYQLTLIH